MSDRPPPEHGEAGDPGGEPALGGYTGEVPPEAGERLGRGPWTSGLSVNDLAACVQIGLRPVALVQGFCVMQWSWYGSGSPYGYYYGGGGGTAYGRSPWRTTLSRYSCPHNYMSMEHRFRGENFEQRWKSEAWAAGFNAAYQRMIDEAGDAGAEGVIGVVDTVSSLIDRRIREFHIYGTAVAADDERPTGEAGGGPTDGAGGAGGSRPIWTTYLAGQRLVKLLEAGFAPRSVVASMASVRIWAVCVTEMLMHGNVQMGMGVRPSEIMQVADAQMQVRDLARDHVKSALGSDLLQGADLGVAWNDVGEGDFEVEAVLRGSRVRPFRAADPLPPPELTVRMA